MKANAQVYFKDILAGELFESEEGEYFFTYDSNYLDSEYPAISYSLPKSEKEYFSRSLHGFFDGLLPEGWLLQMASDIYKLNPIADRYDLLLKTCYDPIGAVSIRSTEIQISENCSRTVKSRFGQQESMKTFLKCLYCYEPLDKGLYHEKCSIKFTGDIFFPEIDLDQEILKEIEGINLEDHVSIPGVQHKISLDYLAENKGDRLTITNYAGDYILKPKAQIPHVPENEHLVMKLANVFGIETADSTLALLTNGDFAFVTKRFDRTEKQEKIHVEDFAQIFDQLTVKKYIGSLEKVGKILKNYCANNAPMEQVLRFYELVVFSYAIGNSDLHLKNISVILDPDPRLAPAYDLLSFELYQEDFKERDVEESALAINGKKAKLAKSDFDSLAMKLGIKDKVRNYVYKKLDIKQHDFFQLINNSFLPSRKKQILIDIIKKRVQVFNP